MSLPTAIACSAALAIFTVACSNTPYEGEDIEQPSVPRGSSSSTSAPGNRTDAGLSLERSPSSPATPTPSSPTPSSPSAPPSKADAGTPEAPPAPVNECASPGGAVFAFVDSSEAWRYSTGTETPGGFMSAGLAFRGAPASTKEPTATLYLLKNGSDGDFLVTTVPNEGASAGYAPLAILGKVFLQQVPGSVPLTRYVKERNPLRHRISIDGNADPNWTTEPPRGFACAR